MARAYGDDLRRKVLSAYRSGKGTMKELVLRFDVSYGWVHKIARSERQTGRAERVPQRRALAGSTTRWSGGWSKPSPTSCWWNCSGKRPICADLGHRASTVHLWRVLGKLGLRLKKVAPCHGARQRRKPPKAEGPPPGHRFDPAEDLIYLEESGVSTQMTRLDGRAPKGRRIRDRVPSGHRKVLTILAAMDHTGMLATMTVEASTDGDVFLAYLDRVLCPKLRTGHVVVMDNLSAHKVEGVRKRIEARGASVLDLPPYSPDLNAIEKARSRLKARLRALEAQAMPQFEHANASALATITAQDAQAWIRLRFRNYT